MVKCVDCGFLAARNIKTRDLEEVEQLFRDIGSPVWIGTKEDPKGVPVHERMPLCFMRAYDLILEMEQAQEHPINRAINAAEVQSVIGRDRNCAYFRRWLQGVSPKEHREMMDREKMLEWQAGREEADRKWREEQEAKHSKEEWHRYIFLGVLTVIMAIIGTILGYYLR
jgi:cation transport ATPase